MTLRVVARRSLRPAVGIAVSAVFAAITLSRIDFAMMAHAWQALVPSLVGLAIALSAVEVGVRALRWRLLLSPLATPRIALVYGMLSVGHLANAILPARLGDVARALLAGPRIAASRASVLGTIAVERVADAALLAAAAVVGVVIGYSNLGSSLLWVAAAGLAAGTSVVGAILLLGHRRVAATRAGLLLAQHGRRFLAGASALRRPMNIARVTAFTLASFALASLIMLTAVGAVGLEIAIWQAALVIAVVTLSTAIPAGPASVGTYEFIGMTMMVSLGYPSEPSLLAIALVHAVVVMTPAAIGLVSLWAMGVGPLSSRFGTRSAAPT